MQKFLTFFHLLSIISVLLPSYSHAQVRDIKTIYQKGHFAAITSVTFSHDDKYLLTGGADGIVNVWDFQTGLLKFSFYGHTSLVTVTTHPYKNIGASFARRDSDRFIKVFDFENEKEIALFKKNGQFIKSIFFSEDGEHLITFESNPLTHKKGIFYHNILSNEVEVIDFDYDEVDFLSLSKHGNIFLFDKTRQRIKKVFANGNKVRTYKTDFGEVTKLIPGEDDNTFMLLNRKDEIWYCNFEDAYQLAQDIFPFHIGSQANLINKFYYISNGKLLIHKQLGRPALSLDISEKVTQNNDYAISNSKKYLVLASGLIYNIPEKGIGKILSLFNLDTGQEIPLFNKLSFPKRNKIPISKSNKNNEIAIKALRIINNWQTTYLGGTEHCLNELFNLNNEAVASFDGQSIRLKTKRGISLKRDGVGNKSNDPFGAQLQFIPSSGNIALMSELDSDHFHIYDKNDLRLIKTINVKSGCSCNMEFHPDPTKNLVITFAGKYVDVMAFNTPEAFPCTKIHLFKANDGTKIRSIKISNDHVRSAKFNYSGNLLATGTDLGDIKLWEINSWKEIAIFQEHFGTVTSLQFSKNGELLFSTGMDGKINVWDIASRKLLYTMQGDAINEINIIDNYVFSELMDGKIVIWDWKRQTKFLEIVEDKNRNYFIQIEGGLYSVSKKEDLIGFKIGLNVYSLNQFDLLLNRPHEVLKHLSCKNSTIIDFYQKGYEKRLKKFGLSEKDIKNLVSFHIPTIKINNKKNTRYKNSSSIELSVSALDENYTLDRINIFVNGVPIFGFKGIAINHLNTNVYNQTIEIPLSNGNNIIQVSCHNQIGLESLKETKIVFNNTKPNKKNNLYLVCIGVDRFKESKFNLKYPVKDLENFLQLYKRKAKDFENIITYKIYNQNLSVNNLQNIKQKLQQSKVDDQVILFVAGHGIIDENFDYYLATHNTDFTNPSLEAIPYEELENLLDGIPARNKLFLMDACHSGEFDKEEMILKPTKESFTENIKFRSFGKTPTSKIGLSNSFELMKELFVDLRRGTGATIISSAGGVEFAWEGDQWQNSVFTYSLLSGLKEGKADLNQDGKIMVSELQKHLALEVSKLTNNQQQPTMRIENISNDWQVW